MRSPDSRRRRRRKLERWRDGEMEVKECTRRSRNGRGN